MFLIIWVILSIVAGFIASGKGRSGIGFFFLALILSPVVGIIAALIISPSETEMEIRKLRTGQNKKCPFCAELIKAEAKVCRYCSRDLLPYDEI